MTTVLILLGVFLWGCVVGAILCYWTGARYALDLHARLSALEQQRIEIVRTYTFTPHEETIAVINQRIFDELFGDDFEDEDGEPVTKH